MTHPNIEPEEDQGSERVNGGERRDTDELIQHVTEDDVQLSPLPTHVTTASEHAMSPRVSTVGTDDSFSANKQFLPGREQYVGQDFSAPGLDSLHWAGVNKKNDFDQRSIASSMNVEKDDKSVYEVDTGMGTTLTYEEEERPPTNLETLGSEEAKEVDRVSNAVMEEDNGLEEVTLGMDDRVVSLALALDGDRVLVHLENIAEVPSEEELSIINATESIVAGSSACASSVASPHSLNPRSPNWENREETKFDHHLQQEEELDNDSKQPEPSDTVEEISLHVDDVIRDTERIQLDEDTSPKDPQEEEHKPIEEDREEMPPQQGEQQNALPKVDMGQEWESLFKGLLYEEGIDALGRPVIVLDADAVPPRMKSSAVTYVKTHIEPIVSAGDYVIVFTAKKAKLPTFWIMGAYQSLPRPYRKNVQYIILVRPSAFLKAILAFMRPFVSKKAARKIKVVESVEEIGDSTSGEVTMHHLGDSFLQHEASSSD